MWELGRRLAPITVVINHGERPSPDYLARVLRRLLEQGVDEEFARGFLDFFGFVPDFDAHTVSRPS